MSGGSENLVFGIADMVEILATVVTLAIFFYGLRTLMVKAIELLERLIQRIDTIFDKLAEKMEDGEKRATHEHDKLLQQFKEAEKQRGHDFMSHMKEHQEISNSLHKVIARVEAEKSK